MGLFQIFLNGEPLALAEFSQFRIQENHITIADTV